MSRYHWILGAKSSSFEMILKDKKRQNEMIETPPNARKENRVYWLDNLRTFMIFLVVLYHAGLVYVRSEGAALFWIVDDYATNRLADILNYIVDIFIMATLFFVSGYLTPSSLQKKGAWAFLKAKFKRLIFPWVIAVLTLMPLYKVIYLYSRSIPQENWGTYFHWNNGIFGQNWLWFLPVLFVFHLVYLLFSKIKPKLPRMTLKVAIGVVFIIGFVYSLSMDILNWQGWTKTVFLDFQNERLLIYFMIFLLGSLCYKLQTFQSELKKNRLYIILLWTVWIPLTVYLILYMNTAIKPGNIMIYESVDTLLLWFFFHVSLLWLLYVMVNTFRYHLNKQGKLGRLLSENSYYVYIIHVIVMGGIALFMIDLAIPSLLKYFVLTISTYIGCNLIIYIFKNVLNPKHLLFTRRNHQ